MKDFLKHKQACKIHTRVTVCNIISVYIGIIKMYIQEFWDKIYFPSPSAFCPETRGPWATSLTCATIYLYFN